MLIQLTSFNSKQPIMLNTDLIECIYPFQEDTTKIVTINNSYRILENYYRVKALIFNEIKKT